MKIAFISDSHIGRYLQSREGDLRWKALRENQIRFLREVFFRMLDREKIRHVIHLGDLVEKTKHFHFEDLMLIREEFIEPLLQRGITVYFIVGNHDTLTTTTNLKNVYDLVLQGTTYHAHLDPKEITIGGFPILMIPWINPENQERAYATIRASTAKIAVGHLGFKGCLSNDGTPGKHEHDFDLVKHFDAVFMGHYHNRNSVKNVHYIGAMSPLHHNDEEGGRGFTIFDTEQHAKINHEFQTATTFVKNPFKIFYDVFYNDERKTLKDMMAEVDDMHLRHAFVRLHVETKQRPEEYARFQTHLERRDLAKLDVRDYTHMIVSNDTKPIEHENENIVGIMQQCIDELDYEAKGRLKAHAKLLFDRATNRTSQVNIDE